MFVLVEEGEEGNIGGKISVLSFSFSRTGTKCVRVFRIVPFTAHLTSSREKSNLSVLVSDSLLSRREIKKERAKERAKISLDVSFIGIRRKRSCVRRSETLDEVRAR